MKVYSSSVVSPEVSREESRVQNHRFVTLQTLRTKPCSWKYGMSISPKAMGILGHPELMPVHE